MSHQSKKPDLTAMRGNMESSRSWWTSVFFLPCCVRTRIPRGAVCAQACMFCTVPPQEIILVIQLLCNIYLSFMVCRGSTPAVKAGISVWAVICSSRMSFFCLCQHCVIVCFIILCLRQGYVFKHFELLQCVKDTINWNDHQWLLCCFSSFPIYSFIRHREKE